MLAKDGSATKVFAEPGSQGDPFTVSDVDTMLAFINAEVKAPESVALISRLGCPHCPHCQRAKALLIDCKIRFDEIVVGQNIDQVALCGLSGSPCAP
jgi:hypothetical protein